MSATVAYHQERLNKAPSNAKEDLKDRIKKTEDYAGKMLVLAKELGGKDAVASPSVTDYALFEVNTAKDRDFYSSFVALIPCYLVGTTLSYKKKTDLDDMQGYYLIGQQMKANQAIDKSVS